MNGINLARTITTKRKEKQLTQDDLASFMGVTKASVSKWETGQSYPDITLLPHLAAFFNISIDELMGYEPQMTDQDIRKLYKELSIEFTAKPFDEVMGRCREITRKYYSCFNLLLQVGLLYINYGYYTVPDLDDEEKAAIVAEAKELFVRIQTHSDDHELRHLTMHLVATCELLLGKPEEVIALFQGKRHYPPATNEILLSQAYLMAGKVIEAKKELQNSLYDGILEFLSTVPSYLQLCVDDAARFDLVCMRTLQTIDIWKANKLIPAGMMPFYLVAAAGYLAHGAEDKALDMLHIYTEIANDLFPLGLKRDSFFDLVDIIAPDELPFGIAEAPRDENTIRESVVTAFTENPALNSLHENQRFKNMIRRLESAVLRTAK